MKKKHITLILISMVLILIICCPIFTDKQADEFENEKDDSANSGFIKTVDSIGSVGQYTSIAVNGANVYISYLAGAYLKFARSTDDGATWPTGDMRIVDSTVLNVGYYPSITVIGNNVYISYYDLTNRDLKFARSFDSGTTWLAGNIKTVDSAGSVGEYTSIAVDGSNVYISYYDSTNGDLKFTRSTDSGTMWAVGNIKTVDSAGDIGYETSITVNGSNIYISYLDLTNSDLKFARSTDSGVNWLAGNIKTIDSAGIVGDSPSIAVDSSNVYISYYDSTNGDLKFARSTDSGATWLVGNIKTVDFAGVVGGHTSIAVNGANVYISYFDETNDDLKFARSTDSGATWLAGNIKTVDSAGTVGLYNSTAVNGTNVYISYYDSTNEDLKFTKSTDSGETW